LRLSTFAVVVLAVEVTASWLSVSVLSSSIDSFCSSDAVSVEEADELPEFCEFEELPELPELVEEVVLVVVVVTLVVV